MPKAETEIFYSYFATIKPELDRQFKTASAQLAQCLPEAFIKQAHPVLSTYLRDSRCAGILALQCGIDIKGAIGFIVSFQMLCFCLDYICESRALSEEALVNHLYQALCDSVDIGRVPGTYGEYLNNIKLGTYITGRTEACRAWIAGLPSYSLAAGNIKKYLHTYVCLQSYKHQPLKLRREMLVKWSEYYTRQYQDVGYQEFAASADSLLGIYSMLFAASRKQGDGSFSSSLNESDLKALDSAYVPWICAFHKLLQHFVSAREDVMMGRLNFSDFYDDLKQCEAALISIFLKSLKSCINIENSEYHSALVKLLPAIYLSDPRSQFGLNRLASRNILASAPRETPLLHTCCKLTGMGS